MQKNKIDFFKILKRTSTFNVENSQNDLKTKHLNISE